MQHAPTHWPLQAAALTYIEGAGGNWHCTGDIFLCFFLLFVLDFSIYLAGSYILNHNCIYTINVMHIRYSNTRFP